MGYKKLTTVTETWTCDRCGYESDKSFANGGSLAYERSYTYWDGSTYKSDAANYLLCGECVEAFTMFMKEDSED